MKQENALGKAQSGYNSCRSGSKAAGTARMERGRQVYTVSRDGGMAMDRRLKLVVVGNGMAGVRCVEEILKLAPYLYDITIIGKEPHPNYNRIMLSKVLQGDTSIADITINSLRWYEEQGITLYIDETVERIETSRAVVQTNKGRSIPYDRLIIATGSNPFMLPLPGADKAGVTAFRSIEDCERMMESAKHNKRAVVIGGGLLGLEAARGLLNLGMEVKVVHIYNYLMERQLDLTASEMLRKELESQGMQFIMGKQTERILGRKRVEGVQFSDGTRLTADLVVFAVGIRPNVKLAADSGIEVNRGIVVNDRMETSAPRVYAVGECAEHRGMVYGLAAPLYEQGKVLAKVLCDVETEGYGGSTLYSQLKVSGVDVFSVGEIMESDSAETIKMYNGLARTYLKIIIRNERIAGAVMFGDISDSSKLLHAIKQGAGLSVLDDIGRQSGESVEVSKGERYKAVMMMAEKEIVCSCNGVSKGVIVQAICDKKLGGVDEVQACTRASSSCGGCKPLVQTILDYVLESGGAVELKKESLCGCTTLSHEELREAMQGIDADGLINDDVMKEQLGWLNKDGCEVCEAALKFYTALWRGKHELIEEQFQLTVHTRHPIRNSIQMGKHLEKALSGLVFPAELSLGVAAGLFYSAGMLTKDVSLIGTPSGWELYAGGSDGGFGQLGLMQVRQAQLICTEEDDAAALELALALLLSYRSDADYGETVAEWLERVGTIALRERIFTLDNRERLLSALNASLLSQAGVRQYPLFPEEVTL